MSRLTHPGTAYGVTFSPDGKRLATASNAQIVKVWDVLSGQKLLSFTGHTSAIVSRAFRPDGKRLATASRDGTAKIWNAPSGQEFPTLEGSGVVYGVWRSAQMNDTCLQGVMMECGSIHFKSKI